MMYVKNQNLNQRQLVYKGLIAILMLFSGCTTVHYTKSVPGQPQSTYYSFSRDTTKQILEVLDTNMLYVNAQDWVRTYEGGRTEKLFLYRYIKFGGNRIAFFSEGIKEPLNEINVNYANGEYCFYKIENNEVQVEIYDLHLKKFIIWTGKIYPDRIYFYKHQLRIAGGGKGKLDLVYNKETIKYTRPLVWPQ